MVVHGGVAGGVVEPLCKAAERSSMAPAFVGEFADEVDDVLSRRRRCCPELEGEVAADEVEVEVVDAKLALLGEVTGHRVRAGELPRRVLDEGAIVVLGESALVLALLEGLGVMLLALGHKLRLLGAA